MVQLALGIAGAALLGPAGLGFSGFLGVSGAGIGFAVGSALGASLFAPNQRIEGPRLGDLQIQGSAYGQPLPIVEGQFRVANNIIWASEIRETQNTVSQSGKGGPKVTTTTYTYDVDLAFAICEGEMAALLKIYADSKLVKDYGGSKPFEEVVAATLDCESVTFYPGSETQLPDPTIEADKGVGNVPAYLGTCYVVIKGLQLADYGNRIPQFTFEVTSSASDVSEVSEIVDTSFGGGFNRFGVIRKDVIYTVDAGDQLSNVNLYTTRKTGQLEYSGISNFTGLSATTFQGALPVNSPGDPQAFVYFLPTSQPSVYVLQLVNLVTNEYTLLSTIDTSVYSFTVPSVTATDPITGLTASKGQSAGQYVGVYGRGTDGTGIFILPTYTGETVQSLAAWRGKLYVLTDKATGIYCHVFECNEYDSGGNLLDPYEITTTLVTATGGANMIFASDDGVFTYRFGNIPSSVFRSLDEAVSFEEYASGIDTPDTTGNQRFNWYCNNEYMVTGPCTSDGTVYLVRFNVPSGDGELLSDIVERRCNAAGLLDAQIETADLTDTVHGYFVPRQGSSRAAIEPLASAYFFDAVESDGKVKFIKRGAHAPVVTIPYEDLASVEFGGTPGDPLPFTRQQEDELPKSVAVTFFNKDVDYQGGSEAAQRINTTSQTAVSQELPIATTGDFAAGVANKLLWQAWADRMQYSFATTRKYAHLDPADVVLVEHIPGQYKRLSLRTANDTGLLCEFSAVEDFPVIYDQEYLGASPTTGAQTTADNVVLPTTFKVLDSPIFRDADDFPGPYIANASTFDSWSGAVDFSGPSEAALVERGSVTRGGTMGFCTSALGNYTGPLFFDMINSVTVAVNQPLYSNTRANVLANTINTAYIGGEVVKYLTATLVSTGVYTLTGLLRGLLGTEDFKSTHVAGEDFVLLEDNGLLKLQDQASTFNQVQVFKAVTFGQRIIDAQPISKTITGRAVKPLAPVDLRKLISGSDRVITWKRRSRYSGDGLTSMLPLGETSEAYEVDVYADSTFSSVVRTLSSASESATYTAAQMAADLGGTPATLYVRVYQLSTVIGRGIYAQGSL